ncbi:sugar ABC transporter substrate-binding protein [Nonomuraea sp. NPDC050404]|uniref:ABC transporter substrate-binding protein n=1 Tax=Nonomuraea sp. NPDC050404 TaxID=3155783 RepID=UPI0033CF96CA
MRPGRKLSAAALVALLALSSACASEDGGVTDTGTLRWAMWSGSSAETETWKRIGALAADSGTALELQTTSFNDYWTKTAAQASTGQTACLIGVQSLRVPLISSLLRPLDADLARAGIDAADFDPSIWKSLRVGGDQLAVPYDYGPQVVLYNATRFRELGVPLPKPGWTVADFEAAAKALTRDGRWGFAANPVIDGVIPWSLSLQGVNPIGEGGKVDLTQPGFVATMRWYVDLIGKQRVAPPVQATSDMTPGISGLISGSVAMTVDGPWQLVNVMDQADFEVGVAPLPAGKAGSRSQVAGSGFGISRTCKDPEAALRALAAITGPRAAKMMAENGRAYPARTAQQDAWFSPELTAARPGLQAAISAAVPARSAASYSTLDQLFRQYGVPVMNGQEDVSGFLESVQQQVN